MPTFAAQKNAPDRPPRRHVQQSTATGWTAHQFWRRWVGANALAEAVGLGTSALLSLWLIPQLDRGTGAPVIAILVVVGSTLLEGTAVGLAQWRVLRVGLPRLSGRAWWLATMAGAFIAWTLGMVPSTVMSMMEQGGDPAPVAEPAAWLVYLLAAGMGLLLGPILAGAQWVVLRHHVRRAWIWLPANALAWAAGMVIIFWGVGMAAEQGEVTPFAVTIIILSLLLAGAVVGAIHGAFLLRLLDDQS